MLKEEAIQEFLKLREEVGISRDKAIEVYNFFKLNPSAYEYTYSVGVDQVTIPRTELWSVINTTTIRELCKKSQTLVQCGDLSYLKLDFDGDEDNNDIFTSSECTKLRKDALAYKTKLDFERKAFNKQLKDISTLEELNRELIDKLKELKPTSYTPDIKKSNGEYNSDVLVVHLSDLHLGEITSEFQDTGFDMNIASKRLKKFAEYIKREIITKNIEKVVIMCCGDVCNNVTLLSKRLLQTSNRAVTTIMAVILLQHFILDIYSVCPNISFAGVGSNEARYDEDYFEDEYLITNCADYVVYNMLELLFKDFKTINFLQGRNNEKIVNINGYNFLLTHGVGFSKGDVEKGVQQAISRYSVKGIDIRYVLMGHIHCTRNSNFFSRSGSLVGANAYSNSTLNLQTRASQNILFVGTIGDVNSLSIDLENVSFTDGYDISIESVKFGLKSRDNRTDLDNIQFA